MNKNEMDKTKTFWTADRLTDSKAIFLIEADLDYFRLLRKSDHEGVLLLPKDAEILVTKSTPKGGVLMFIETSYPTFLEWIRHTTLEERLAEFNGKIDVVEEDDTS
jgi:hypothetical protein